MAFPVGGGLSVLRFMLKIGIARPINHRPYPWIQTQGPNLLGLLTVTSFL